MLNETSQEISCKASVVLVLDTRDLVRLHSGENVNYLRVLFFNTSNVNT
jgi:hypothetical protein